MAFSPLNAMPQELFTRELLKSEKKGHRRNASADAVLTPSASLRLHTDGDEEHAAETAGRDGQTGNPDAKKGNGKRVSAPGQSEKSAKPESRAWAFLKFPTRGLKWLGRHSPNR